jgi:hypothetical protein
MDISGAQAVLQAEADRLTAALHAKGYERSHAEIWVGRKTSYGSVTIFIENAPEGMFHPTGASVAEAVKNADEKIVALPDAHAIDAWFDLSHPINQPIAQAAE